MTATRPTAPRGVTLVELMVALLIGSVVITAVLGVVQSQQRAYVEGHHQRAAQGSARSALLFIEQKLLTAGWGLDAPLAFDFDRYAALPCPALAAPCARDRTDGNDELVFYSRDPRYWVPDDYVTEPVGNAWRITGLAGNTLTINARPGDRFVRGQIVQAVCRAGSRYAYFTVGASTPVVAAAGGLPITLAGSVPANPFLRQAGATDACFIDGNARLFLIDRYRFHVRPVRVGAETQPYLVLDRGLDANNDGPDEAEELIIAEGVELFQVGYVMTNGALAARGTVPGTPIGFAQGAAGATAGVNMTTLLFPGVVPAGQSEYRPTSWYGYSVGPPPAVQRMDDHQANIRAVRIAMVTRSPTAETSGPGSRFLTPLLNMTALPAWVDPNATWARNRLETTVLVRNMASRGMNDF